MRHRSLVAASAALLAAVSPGAAPQFALAHDCELSVVEVEVGKTTENLLVVRADRKEKVSDYVVTFLNGESVARVSPSGSFRAHDGVLRFTGLAPGTALIRVDWAYEPTDASGSCFVLVDVGAPDVPGTTAASQPNASDTEEPVTLSTGEYWLAEAPDLALGGPFPLVFERYYASRLADDGRAKSALGLNWLTNFDLSLETTGDKAWVVAPRGQVVRFVRDGAAWTLADPGEEPFQLVGGPDETYFGDPRTRRVYTFGADGALTRIEDGHGNAHTLSWFDGRLAAVTDGLGRTLAFSYAAGGGLAGVSDGAREVTFEHADGLLASVTGADGGTTTYSYDADHAKSGLMTSMTRPLGNTLATQVYDASGRVVRQTDALGNRTDFTYGVSKNGATTATLRDAAGGKSVFPHDAAGGATGWTDAAGRRVRIAYDDGGRRESAVDAAGGVARYAYDGTGARSRIELPGGASADVSRTTWTFRGIVFREVSEVRYGDGSTDAYTWDASGNLTSWKDREARTWTYTYLPGGLLETTRSPVGGVERRTYDAWRRLESVTDPFGATTTYEYDAFDRPARVTRDDGSFATFEYDPAGRLTRRVDASGNATLFTFDANGNLVRFTDAAGSVTTYVLDAMDRIVRIDAPLGATSTAAYDVFGRLVETTDAEGGMTRIVRDRAGRVVALEDDAGGEWARSHDALGRLTGVGAPGVPGLRYAYDASGRLSRIVGGDGSAADVLYDALGNLAGVADPSQGLTWTLHDRTGALTTHDPPGDTGGAWITYDGLRRPVRFEDGRGNAWTHDHDATGRRTGSEDPLGLRTGYGYDELGRLSVVDRPDGVRVDLSYDALDRVTKRSFGGGFSLSYEYDALGRTTKADGFAATYDARGDMSSCNGMTFVRDLDGRLTGVQYAPGKAVTYVYGAGGLLSRVEDWAGGAFELLYDDARRLTSVRRQNATTTEFTYTPDGRLTGILDRNGVVFGDQRIVRDGGGRVVDAFRDLPVTPGAPDVEGAWGFDAGCRTLGFTYAPTGHLLQDDRRTYRWDVAGRLAGYDEGMRHVDFTWDGNGLPLTRMEDGTTWDFVWNLTTPTPCPAVVRRDGQDDRYYVWTPDGQLLWRIDAATNDRHFYHFDESGNVTMVTGDDAAIEGAWSYDPFGLVTGMTGGFDDFFGFGGQGGVISEPGGDLRLTGPRVYDARMGNYASPAEVATVSSGVQLNPYLHAQGDPVNRATPAGEETRGSGIFRDATSFALNIASPGSFISGLLLEGTPVGQVLWYGKNTPVTPNFLSAQLNAARTYAAEARAATNATQASRALALANAAIEDAKVIKGQANAMTKLGEGAFALGAALEVYDAKNKIENVSRETTKLFNGAYQTFEGQLNALFEARKSGRISQREYLDRVAEIRSQFDASIENTKSNGTLQTVEEGLRGFARALGQALPGPLVDFIPGLK